MVSIIGEKLIDLDCKRDVGLPASNLKMQVDPSGALVSPAIGAPTIAWASDRVTGADGFSPLVRVAPPTPA